MRTLRAVVDNVGALLSPLYLLLAWFIARSAMSSVVPAIGLAVLLLGVGAPLFFLRFTRGGRSLVDSSTHSDWLGTYASGFAMLAAATAGFSLLSALCYDAGWGHAKGLTPEGAASVDLAYVTLLWHLADAVPLLDLPKTLNWQLSHPFTDHFQGGLMAAYKLCVVIPVLFVGAKLFGRLIRDED